MGFERFVWVCGIALLTPGMAGCKLYDPELVRGDTSGLTRPPPRPEMEPLPDVDRALVFALHDVVIDQAGDAAWREIGLDLDGFASEPGGLQACTLNPEAKNPSVQGDGVGGIDNVFGASFYAWIAAQVGLVADGLDPQVAARTAHDAGDGTMVVRITGWNGTANDEKISVVLAQAVDGTPADRSLVYMDGATNQLRMIADGELAPEPAWDGTDNWWVREDGFLDGNPSQPYQRDDNAYLADGMLVHRLTDRPIFFRMGDAHAVEIVYRDAWVVTRLSADFESLTDIVVAGRWSILDLLETAQGVELCLGDPSLDLLHREALNRADVASDSANDGTGANCDALSMAVRFEGAVKGDWTPSVETIAPGRAIPSYCAGQPDGGI